MLIRILILFSVLCFTLHAADEPKPNRTGEYTVTFAERSPLSAKAEFEKRYKFESKREDYDITKESYKVYVPANYAPGKPFGLVVFINSANDGWLPFPKAADAHQFIWISANNSGNERSAPHRWGMSLDAVFNMKKLYSIDDDRVYVSGISGGGRCASMVALVFPEYWKGAIYSCGCNAYKNIPIPGQGGRFWPAAYPPPSKETMSYLGEEGRYVFHTNEKDFNRAEAELIEGLYKKDGFKHTMYLEEPNRGHELYTEGAFEKAITFMDAPLTEKSKATFDEALKLEKSNKYDQAFALFTKVTARAPAADFGKDAAAHVEAMLKNRELDMVTAQSAFDAKHYSEAGKILSEMSTRWSDKLPEAATKLLERLKADPTVLKEIQAAKDQASKDKLEAEGLKELEIAHTTLKTDIPRGFATLQAVAQRYQATKAGQDAKAEVEAFQKDPAKMKQLQGAATAKESAMLLRKAKMLLKNEDFEGARNALNSIIKEYPASPEVPEAKTLLDQAK